MEWSDSRPDRVKSPRYPLNRRLDGSQNRSGRCGKEKIKSLHVSCWKLNSGHPVRSLVSILTELYYTILYYILNVMLYCTALHYITLRITLHYIVLYYTLLYCITLYYIILYWLGIFPFTTASRTALGPTQPPIQWVRGALSLGVKRPGREADHSPPSSVEVKE
jgi:hypothetical protein